MLCVGGCAPPPFHIHVMLARIQLTFTTAIVALVEVMRSDREGGGRGGGGADFEAVSGEQLGILVHTI